MALAMNQGNFVGGVVTVLAGANVFVFPKALPEAPTAYDICPLAQMNGALSVEVTASQVTINAPSKGDVHFWALCPNRYIR